MDRYTLVASAVAGVIVFAIVGAAAMTPDPAATGTPPPHPSATRPPAGGEALDRIPAPDFAIPTDSGEAFRLSEHRGRVVVLNLWATWCPPCRHEIPDFIALHETYANEGLTVVGVSIGDEGWDAVRPFAEDLEISYPIAVDDGTVEGLYGPTYSLPTTFVIDRKGDVVHYIPGMVLRDQLEPLLLPLLRAPAAS